jgi:hypothetical protein
MLNTCLNNLTDPTNANGCDPSVCLVTNGFWLNLLENKMKIDPDAIIKACETYAHQHYRDGLQPIDRMAYQCGLLHGKIRELCNLLDAAEDEIKSLQLDIMQLKADQ